MNQEIVGNESSALGQRLEGRRRNVREEYARRWMLFFEAHRRVILTSVAAVIGLLVAAFLIVSSRGQGMNPVLPVGLGFFAAYIAVRRKDG
jgi:hypothetical protein